LSTFGQKKLLKVLLLTRAPLHINPSQRFRFEQFLPFSCENGIDFMIKPFFDANSWANLFKKGIFFSKSTSIIFGLLKRYSILPTLYKYDYVYIHRETAPVGPPIFEWLMAKVFKKKLIYDFDDAIWIPTSSDVNPFAAKIKCNWKVSKICSYSHIVTVGNSFLASFAKKYCSDVRIIPTIVNTENHHNRIKNQNDTPIVIGWTGTFTNFYNLEIILPYLSTLKKKYNFNFLIIADRNPDFKSIDYEFTKWDLNTEIDDLLKINIGIMPLKNSDFEMGKCAFKAIQYMSLGIPAVVSAVGANKKVVDHEINGYLIENEVDWLNKLEHLLNNLQLRTDIGLNARKKIIAEYSVNSCKSDFYNLFNKI